MEQDNPCFSQYSCFQFIDYIAINTKKFELPSSYGQSIILLEYQPGELFDASIEPVVIYHFAGTKKFIWRNLFWSKCEIYPKNIAKIALNLLLKHEITIEYRTKLQNMVDKYNTLTYGVASKSRVEAMYKVEQ